MVEEKQYDFYFASPFFNETQVEREERLKARLRELGYTVFSPKELTNLPPVSTNEDRKRVFKQNVDNIDKARAVFAVTDERDMGTIWESGYAYAKRKPIIYYAETLGNRQFNLMLAQSGNVAITKFEDLTKEIVDKVLNEGFTADFDGEIE